MERPFFSLAKRKRLTPIDYQSPDGTVWVKVQPHQDYGMATIWDADILIWAASQIAEHMRSRCNEPPPRTIQFLPHQLLQTIMRDVGGDQYRRLRASLDRLKTTTIKTNIRGKGKDRQATFSWIDQWTDDVDAETGQSKGMSITISEWLFEGVTSRGSILSIHPNYFLLSGAFERWLYRVVRKHAGNQKTWWMCTLIVLYKKSGCEDRQSKFKAAIKKIVNADLVPEYFVSFIDRTESGDSAIHAIRREYLDSNHPGFKFPCRKDKRRPHPFGMPDNPRKTEAPRDKGLR
jgi:plasmid replication initiation protein